MLLSLKVSIKEHQDQWKEYRNDICKYTKLLKQHEKFLEQNFGKCVKSL